MSSTLIWKDEKLLPEWIFLRNRRPKLVKIGHFRSISKNCWNLKIFGPISLQNPTQRIFHFIKKVVSPLLFALWAFFPLKITCFYSISKNCRKLKFFWPISLRNSTQRIFHLLKKVVSPLLFPLRTFFPLKITVFSLLVKIVENWKFFGQFPFKIQRKEFFIW